MDALQTQPEDSSPPPPHVTHCQNQEQKLVAVEQDWCSHLQPSVLPVIDTSEAQSQFEDSSSPKPHVTQTQSQGHNLAASQHETTDQVAMARLPRIPPVTNDCPRTMTLQELWDWKAAWREKGRPPTASERLDYDECDRQIDDLASETTMDWEEFEQNEQYMDTCPSPTQRDHPAWTTAYQLRRVLRRIEARKEARKRVLSPPRTPPRLKGPKLYNQQHAETFRIEKVKRNDRKAPRRPITRTFGTPDISLHDRKGQVKYWHTMTKYVVISYEKYLRDYDREELDKYPPEPMDFSREHPRYPRKTDYQREVCRRVTAQDEEMKNSIMIPLYSWKGNK